MCRIMRYFGVYGDFTINEMSEFVLNEWSGGDCGARAEATIVPIDNIGLGRAPTNLPDSIGCRISGGMFKLEIRWIRPDSNPRVRLGKQLSGLVQSRVAPNDRISGEFLC